MTTTAVDLDGTWALLGTGPMVVQKLGGGDALIFIGTAPDAGSPGLSLAAAFGTLNLNWVTDQIHARALRGSARVVVAANTPP
jgi:hypothetical protein